MTFQQIGWTLNALHTDKHFPYSGDWATARFLKSLPRGTTVAGFNYHATGALAYLDDFKYINQPHSYWIWSNKVRINQQAPSVLAQQPDYFVVGGFTFGSQGDMNVDWAPPVNDLPYMHMADAYRIRAYFLQHNYVERDRFGGRLLMRDSYSEEVCDIVLERQTHRPAPGADPPQQSPSSAAHAATGRIRECPAPAASLGRSSGPR
jgi:hypothetical protein